MSAELIAVYVAGALCALIALAIASDYAWEDWGLAGVLLFCTGIAAYVLLTWLRTHRRVDGWETDLRWFWVTAVDAGALVVLTGLARRAWAGRHWPPARRTAVHLLLAVLIPVVIVLFIHLLRQTVGAEARP